MSAMKRPSPLGDEEERSNKKLKPLIVKHHHKLRYRQPGSRLAAVNSQDSSVIDQQLCRALCITLFSAGFTSADTSALAAFQAQVDMYMRHFASRIKESMQHSRRAKPLPQDFIHALAAFEITPSSLLPDLGASIPAIVTQQPVLLSSLPSQSSDFTSVSHFDEGVNLRSAKQAHRYIPKHFPNFPAEHAYRRTDVFANRETDPRRLRELSSREGTLAEQALRKLVAANRIGLRHRARSARSAEQEAQRKKTEGIWRDALTALIQEDAKANDDSAILPMDEPGAFTLDGSADKEGPDKGSAELLAKEIDAYQGVLVNYDRVHWRRGNTHGKGLPAG